MVTNDSSMPPEGVSCALLTPVTANGSVDAESLDRLVARAAAAGVRGLSPIGSTGEGSRLSREQRLQVVKQVAGAGTGLPVMSGAPSQALDDVLHELDDFAAAGAQAGLVAPPGYYASSDAGVLAYFTALAARSPLPLVLYHIPAMAGVGFSPEVVAELADHPAVVGLKDSSRDLEYLRAVVRATVNAEFAIVTGTDALLVESLDSGAVGAIAASPNVAPGLAVQVWDAWSKRDLTAARGLQDDLQDLVTVCRRAGFPAGWKYAAAAVGACSNYLLPPGVAVAEGPVVAGIDRKLVALGLTA